MNELEAIDLILRHEGGYVNHPRDPGGATNMGITHRTYAAWLRGQGAASKSVRDITRDEAVQIYLEGYWYPSSADKFPRAVGVMVFDYAVNSGPGRAIKELQRTVGVDDDGRVGPITIAAVNRAYDRDPAGLLLRFARRRMSFLKRLRHWPTFARGWTRRVMGRIPGAQITDEGTVDVALSIVRRTEAMAA